LPAERIAGALIAELERGGAMTGEIES